MMERKVDVSSMQATVELNGVCHTLAWPADRSLVSILTDAGLDPPHSCLVGKCGACVCTLVEGRVTLVSNEVLDADDLAEGYILACQARPDSNELHVCFE